MNFDSLDYIVKNHEKMLNWAKKFTSDSEVIDSAFEMTLVTFMKKGYRKKYDNEKPIYGTLKNNIYQCYKEKKRKRPDLSIYIEYLNDCICEELNKKEIAEKFNTVLNELNNHIDKHHNKKVAAKYKRYVEIYCEKIFLNKTKEEIADMHPKMNIDEAFNRVYKIFSDFNYFYKK